MLFKDFTKEKYTILIIDDQPETRNLLVNYLEHNSDYNFYTANSGVIGFEIAKDEIPDIILLDWQMPELDGLEVLKLLKADHRTKDIPVMMYTGIMTDSKSLQTALKLGATDFLRKPIEPIEMEARLKAAIENIKNQRLRIEHEKKILNLETKHLQFEFESRKKTILEYIRFIAIKNQMLGYASRKLKGFIDKNDLTKQQTDELEEIVKYIKYNIFINYKDESILDVISDLLPEFLNELSSHTQNLNKIETEVVCYLKLDIDKEDIRFLVKSSEEELVNIEEAIKEKLGIPKNESLQKILEKNE